MLAKTESFKGTVHKKNYCLKVAPFLPDQGVIGEEDDNNLKCVNVNSIQKYVDNVLIAKEAGTDYMELQWLFWKIFLKW